MVKERKFVCLANGQNTQVTVLVIVDSMIEERIQELNGMREAADVVKERFGYELRISDCFESYEAYRKTMKERRAA